MSQDAGNLKRLAARISQRLSHERITPERPETVPQLSDQSALSKILSQLDNVQRRLGELEAQLTRDNPQRVGQERIESENLSERSVQARNGASAPAWLSGIYVPATGRAETHPSEEKFEVGEAVSELVDFFEGERHCELEPGGKPCDHCAMCSSRGF
jgi:hypothetical protein